MSKCASHHRAFLNFCRTCKQLLCCECMDCHDSESHKAEFVSLRKYAKEDLQSYYADYLKTLENNKQGIENSVKVLLDAMPKLLNKLELFNKKLKDLVAMTTGLISDIKTYTSLAANLCPIIMAGIKKSNEEVISSLWEGDVYELAVSTIRKIQSNFFRNPKCVKENLLETVSRSIEYIEKTKEINTLKQYTDSYAKYVKQIAEELTHYNEKYSVDKAIYGKKLYFNDSKICWLNTETKRTQEGISIPRMSSIVQVQKKVFISGGISPLSYNATPLRDNNEYNKISNELIRKRDMIHGIYGHAALPTSCFAFITIGGTNIITNGYGHNKNGSTLFQEYNVQKNSWKSLPNLYLPRFNAAAMIYNQHYLYAIGGNSKGTIERFDLIDRNLWELMNFTNKGLNLNGLYWAGQISSTEVIIFNEAKEIGVLNLHSRVVKKSHTSLLGYSTFVQQKMLKILCRQIFDTIVLY
eukprot:TRINITY_DN606_c0_g1_i1.p1 TRINITY_DN606_c0_g1~~TRINITY_DN606_c0_g1_i1.p1  ORF type:complete len:468 (-),score=23.57 TRINITY_DN606_c0_g1_i1:521-1924(-)